jgi:DNA-binding beta-propeller fold protein YncE
MGQRWLTWVVALLLIASVTTVVVVFLLQGEGPPEYLVAIGERGREPGKFDGPAGVAVDSSGNLFVLDTGNGRIQRLDPEGKLIGHWGDPGSDTKKFRNPLRIQAVPGSEGILWVADTDNHRLQSFKTTGEFISEVGALGQAPGQFSHPIGMAFDPAGNLWVCDSGNHRLQKFGPGVKNVLAILPKEPKQSSAVGEFDRPWGVACDATGALYVADTHNHRIQRFQKDGTYIGTFGTQGKGPGEFRFPSAILVDRAGNVFVVDSGNNRLQKFDAQGKFLCEWGKAGKLGREFQNPQQIAEGPDGTLYIADTANHRIQKYAPRKPMYFSKGEDVQIPTKPRAPGPTETPLDLPEVPSDDPTPGLTAEPEAGSTPTSSPTPAASPTPVAEPTRF